MASAGVGERLGMGGHLSGFHPFIQPRRDSSRVNPVGLRVADTSVEADSFRFGHVKRASVVRFNLSKAWITHPVYPFRTV